MMTSKAELVQVGALGSGQPARGLVPFSTHEVYGVRKGRISRRVRRCLRRHWWTRCTS